MRRTLYLSMACLLSALSVVGQNGSRDLNPIEKQKLQLPELPASQARASMLRSAGSVDYTKGTFIVNEDWYGHQNSSVNFLSDDGTWTYNAFQKENPGHELGCTSQFGTIYGDLLYIVSKQEKDPGASVTGSRLAVIDAKTMKVKKEFTTIGSADGRSFLGVDEHTGYIGTSGGIYVYDIDNMKIGDPVAGTENTTGSLYTGQVGTMLRVGNKVFAVHQKSGLLVIDPFEHKVDTVILKPENGMGLGSIVLSKDGMIWASVAQVSGSGGTLPYIWKVDPSTLKVVKVAIPVNKGIEEISNSWYAWTADGFCASAKENKIYWKGQGSGSWFTGYAIFCYDIDKQEFYKVFDFSKLEGDWRLYGTGFRIDPVTDDMICFLYHEFLNPEHLVMRIATDGRDETNGTIKGKYPYEKLNYWFPALPVFPDNEAPVVSSKLPSSISLDQENNVFKESLNDIIIDKDNQVSAVVTSVSNDRSDLLDVEVINNQLTIKPLKVIEESVEINLNFKFNSNGKIVNHVVKVNLDKTTLPFYLDKKEISLTSNEQQESLNISCMEGETVSWASDNETVATVEKGLVTTHAPGIAKIIVKSETRENVSDTCIVTVKEYVDAVLIESISFVDAPATIKLGETIKLNVSVAPENASNKEVTWSCTPLNIVSVSNEGEITGVNTGSTTVVATAKDGSKKSVRLSIKCIAADLANVFLGDTLYGVKLGSSSISIPLQLTPINADKTNLKMESYTFVDGKPVGWGNPSISNGNIRITVAKANRQTPVDTKIAFTIKDGVTEYELACRVVFTSWIKSFILDEHEKALNIGDTYNVEEHITIDRGDFTEEEKPILYSSSDTKVMTVNEKGEAVAVVPGTAVITARIADGSFKEQIEFVVLGDSFAKNVTLSEHNVKLMVGESHQLIAVVDEEASVKTIKWRSEYPEQISVTNKGEVLAIKAGRVNVIATSADAAVSDTCVVEVGTPLDRIKISPRELSLDRVDAIDGLWDIYKLITFICYPNDASVIAASGAQGIIKSATVTNTSVITKTDINLYGPYLKLSAGEVGSSYLILETKESGVKDSILIHVTDRSTGVLGVTVEPQKSVTIGDSFTIDATVETNSEMTGLDKGLIWEIEDTGVLSMDDNGEFKALKSGSAIVRVTTKVGGFTSVCQISVVDPLPTAPSVNGVSLNESSLILRKGEIAVLTAIITPSNAGNKDVSWSSSDMAVASVASDGTITAGIAGVAIISVTTDDGEYMATCEVTVIDPDLEKPMVEVKDSTAILIFPKVPKATFYEVSVYKYVNGVPVLFGAYTIDGEGNILTGVMSSLRSGSSDNFKVSIPELDGNSEYIVKITAIRENEGKQEILGSFYSEPFSTSGTVDNENIDTLNMAIYYHDGQLYLNNLVGYHCYIVSLNGHLLEAFEIAGLNECHAVSVPKGVYVVTVIKDSNQISQKVVFK